MQHRECGLSQNAQKLLRVGVVTDKLWGGRSGECYRMPEVLSGHLCRQFLVVCIRYPILSFGAT
jgi:hypothetical protein